MRSSSAFYRWVLVVIAAGFQMQVQAQSQQNPVNVTGGSVGAVVNGASSSETGESGGVAARVEGQSMAMSPNGIGYASGSLEYNVASLGNQGISTGVKGRGEFMIAGSTHYGYHTGCGVYYGLSARVSGEIYAGRPGDTGLSTSIGPETGLVCQVEDVLFTISPTVGIGYTGRTDLTDISGRTVDTDGKGIIRMGAVTRLAIRDKAVFSGTVMAAPQFSDLDSKTTALEGTLEGRYVLSPKFQIGGYVKGVSIRDEGGAYSGGEIGVTAAVPF